MAFQAPGCTGGVCPIALSLYGKGSRPVAVLQTDADCDYSVTLRPIQLFPGRDSIDLVCRHNAGAGWIERRMLVDVTGDALAVIFDLSTGSHIAVSSAEQKAGDCASYPVGSIRVEKTGSRPLLRVVDPESGELQNGKGTLPARQLGYDPDKHTFVPTSAPEVPTQVNARDCRRR